MVNPTAPRRRRRWRLRPDGVLETVLIFLVFAVWWGVLLACYGLAGR